MKIGIKIKFFVLMICLLFVTVLRAELSQTEAMEVGESFKSKVIQAINLKNASEMASYFDDDAILVFENAQIVRTRANIEAYMQAPYLEDDLKVYQFIIDAFNIDSGAIILSDNAFILTGTSVYRIIFSKTKEVKFSNRWVAVMHRNNEVWKISSFQGTVNVFNNPLIEKIKNISYVVYFITFLLGITIAIIWNRFKRVKTI